MTTTLPEVGLTPRQLDNLRAALTKQRAFRIRQLGEIASSEPVAIDTYEDPLGSSRQRSQALRAWS